MYDRNAVLNVMRWVEDLSNECDRQGYPKYAALVIRVGIPMAEKGDLRGDISYELKKLGLDPDRKLGLDLYL